MPAYFLSGTCDGTTMTDPPGIRQGTSTFQQASVLIRNSDVKCFFPPVSTRSFAAPLMSTGVTVKSVPSASTRFGDAFGCTCPLSAGASAHALEVRKTIAATARTCLRIPHPAGRIGTNKSDSRIVPRHAALVHRSCRSGRKGQGQADSTTCPYRGRSFGFVRIGKFQFSSNWAIRLIDSSISSAVTAVPKRYSMRNASSPESP
jgi:hypothetical protein